MDGKLIQKTLTTKTKELGECLEQTCCEIEFNKIRTSQMGELLRKE